MNVQDLGKDFEQRALAVARAKHDPSGLQGPVEFDGSEHDGAFVDETSINVYEFTTLNTKAKAQKDGEKIARLIKHLLADPRNRYKSATGYFVTQTEPEIEQRKVIAQTARTHGVTLHCLSFLALQASLVDVEGYIRLRLNGPFGSAEIRLASGSQIEYKYVEPTLRDLVDGSAAGLDDVATGIASGSRVVLTGDFGIGKSAALRELFTRRRAAYFRKPAVTRFPIHINLRDCVGLRSPREILQRHSEEIGFTGSGGLIAAWRAGQADLLLDGFDELIPARWIGSARDLKSIRWEALAPVRQLIGETPAAASVVVSGRPQYFATSEELHTTLGMPLARRLELTDFDEEQVRRYVGSLDAPAWLPSRPLFVEFLAQDPSLVNNAELQDSDRGRGWRRLLNLIAEREASRISSIPAETFQALIARIAVVARADTDGRGPVSLESMRHVFYETCGYEADAEGVQALLRLPGLASSGLSGADEMRTFVDVDFADAAFAVELARYVEAPYAEHSMRTRARWATASSDLVSEVAADELLGRGFDRAHASACLGIRGADHLYDATLYDVAMVVSHMLPSKTVTPPPFFADILIERLELFDDEWPLSGATFSGCVLEVLDVSEVAEASGFPTFQNCDVGTIVGWQNVPPAFTKYFLNCSIASFSGAEKTTAGLLRLGLSDRERVALTILKKVYAQAGSGRQLPALSRGLPLELRPIVDDVVHHLADRRYLSMGDGRGVSIVRPVRSARRDVMQILEAPTRVTALFS